MIKSTIYLTFLSLTLEKDEIETALKNTLSISFPQFKSQVVSYLPEALILHYESTDAWDEIILKIVNFLEHIDNELA